MHTCIITLYWCHGKEWRHPAFRVSLKLQSPLERGVCVNQIDDNLDSVSVDETSHLAVPEVADLCCLPLI